MNTGENKRFKKLISWLLMLAMLAETWQVPPLTMEVQAGDNGYDYIDAAGVTQNTLTDNINDNNSPAELKSSMTSLSPGWYVVKGTVNYSSSVSLTGDCHIILADGAQMNITADNGRGIFATEANLFIYGQSEGSDKGWLNIKTTGFDGYAVDAKSITVNGGKVSAVAETDGAGLRSRDGDITINGGEVLATATHNRDEAAGILSSGRLIINGGKVTAEGKMAGVCSLETGNAVSLSWRNTEDYFSTNKIYLYNENAAVTIAGGKTFVDKNNNYYITENAGSLKGLTDIELSPSSTPAYTVTFNSNGGNYTPSVQIIPKNDKATKPADPTKDPLHFGGWYMDPDCKNPYSFNAKVTSDLTLYAKWVTPSTSIADASVRTIYRYTGGSVTPLVWDNVGKLLTQGKDYTVNNSTAVKDPGFYNIKVTGMGTYSGSQTARICVLSYEKYDPDQDKLVAATLPDNNVNAAFVTASTAEMNTGYYVVDGYVTAGSRIKVNGDVHLILCDGATLNAGKTRKEGISVTDGNSLTIYSQAGNTGKLIALTYNNIHYAGIGGDAPKAGPIEKAGAITIHGGEILAQGSVSCSAIGQAYGGGAGEITIYGGRITAERNDSIGASGIGGTGSKIFLSHCRDDDYIYSGGYIGEVSLDKPFVIDGTSSFANSSDINGKKLVPTESWTICNVSFDSNGGTAVPDQAVASGRPLTEPEKPIKQGYCFNGWYTNQDLSGTAYDFGSPENKVTGEFTLYAKWTAVPAINYTGADGTIRNFTAYSPMEESYSLLPAGSYFVDKDITLSDRIITEGEVDLILGDGFTLTAEKGISVMGSASLSIFGQSAGTGALKAGALPDNAAIGGDALYGGNNEGSASGTIRIYGGDITARGGYQAAGIGGGLDNVVTGPVYIYGGTIEAYGGQYGACIGGGMLHHNNNSSDGFIVISGGKVKVSANDYGTGIGGGNRSRGGTIRILGGQVTVSVSRNNISGIGAGYAFPREEIHSSDHSKEVEADILLGCSKQDDFILSACYRGNNIRIADNQILKKENGDKLKGEVTDLSTISGNKLTLSHAHSFTYSRNGGTVTATCDDPACAFHGTPAVVSLSAPAGDLTYDKTPKAATLTDESGICDSVSVLYQKSNPDGSWGEAAAEAPKNAGSYRAGITLADTGHGAVSVYVAYEIAQRPVTITGLTPPGRSYDGTTIAEVKSNYATLTGTVAGDDLTFVMGSNNFEDAVPSSDEKRIICSGYYLSGAAAANYILSSQPTGLKGRISERLITIKAKDQTIELNTFIKNDLSEVEIEQGGSLVAGEELKSVTLTPDPEVADHVTRYGEYGTITPGSARIMRGDKDVTGCYRITYTQGNLTITRTMAKVLTEPTARTNLRYSGQNSMQQLINPGTADTSMQYAVQYVSYGDGRPVEGVDGSTSPRDYSSGQDAYKACEAGTYHVWYRAAADTDHEESVAKYVTVNIARVPLTIGLKPETIHYGENPADTSRAHQFTYNGVVGGDSGTLGTGRVSFSECSWDVGSYPLRVSGFSSNNYDITFAPGILTIVPKEVSLDWSATPLTFNGEAQAPTVTAGNRSGNDEITVTVSGAQINAGSGYTATAFALSGEKAGNYRLPSDNTTSFSIAKAAAPAVTDISLELPEGTLSFTASAAGKMPPNAGTLRFNKGSESPIAYVTDWSVDSTTGLVSASISGGAVNDTITFPVTIGSDNYNDATINVKVKLVAKSDAGVAITEGSALSVDYGINTSPTLHGTVSNAGNGGNWTWESSNISVATVTGSSQDCTVTIKGAGTTCITAKYVSSTTTGFAVLNLTVRPGSVVIPEAVADLSYTGSMLTGVTAGSGYTVTGGTGTEPGSYTAVASLTDTLNHRWADGSAEPKYISWSIDKTAGPAAPEGLLAVPPTTGDNLDGKIRGVTADMEFASGISFSDAVPCFGNEIPGLIPGTWYVRIRETATRKPGEAAEVLIPKCTPPLVSAVQGLSYNGCEHVLVTVEAPEEGTLYLAVTPVASAPPADSRYTTYIPSKTDAGSYLVWYKIKTANSETVPQNIRVDIAKTYIPPQYKTLSVNVGLGSECMIEFAQNIPEETCRLSVVSSNESGVLIGKPTLIGKTADCYITPEPEKAGKNAWLTVSVNDMVNYKNYDLLITLTAVECDHPETEMRHINGNVADLCCTHCNAVIKKHWTFREDPPQEDEPDDPPVDDNTTVNNDPVKDPAENDPVENNPNEDTHDEDTPDVDVSDSLLLCEKDKGNYEVRRSKLITLGTSCTLVPRFKDGTVTNERVVWTNSDPSVASVTQEGRITALSCGVTTVSVRSEEKPDLTARCIVTVTDAVTEISLNLKKTGLGIGESVTISATAMPLASDQSFDWTVNNEKVKIFISDDRRSAVVTGVTKGKAKVTVSSRDGSGKKAVCSITVGNPVPDFTVSLKGGASEIVAGKSLALQVRWAGSKPKNTDLDWSVKSADGRDVNFIASVSGKGVLTGITAGEVTVTAISRANPEKSASAQITITSPVSAGAEISAISFTNKDKLSGGLRTGKSFTLKTGLTLSGDGKAAKNEVAWISSDKNIASVSQKGVIKALSPGEVTIIAIPRNAADLNTAPRDSVTFTVSTQVKSIKTDRKKLSLGTQEGSCYGKVGIAAILPAEATAPSIRWTVNNTNIALASVSADSPAVSANFAKAGESIVTVSGCVPAVKGLTPGIAKLTGVTTDGSKKKVSCIITVRGQVTELALKTVSGKNGVNDVTETKDGKYTSTMKDGGSMTLSPVLAINNAKNSGSTKKLYTKYKKYTDTSVSYRSSDTSVLTADKNGKITVKTGVSGKAATVYVTGADGKLMTEILITVK